MQTEANSPTQQTSSLLKIHSCKLACCDYLSVLLSWCWGKLGTAVWRLWAGDLGQDTTYVMLPEM